MQVFEKYVNQLPVIPDVASKILSIGDDNRDFSFKNLEEIISLDPMLTSRILKVANSALYARQKEITTLQMAIGLLGFKNIKSLVLLLTASQFSKKLKKDPFFEEFWKHSIVTAFVAREIYHIHKDRSNQDLAFTLGLLHDIGRVALYNADPEAYRNVLSFAKSNNMKVTAAEKELLKTDHMEVGAALMAHWNLPDIFAESAGKHGDLNIFSAYKKIIANIAAADFISVQLGYRIGNLGDHSMSEELLKNSNITAEDYHYFLNEYQNEMEGDQLFKECRKLFLEES